MQMISKEVFFARMDEALKMRKIKKADRNKACCFYWAMIETGSASADDSLEHEEKKTRLYLIKESAHKKINAGLSEHDEQVLVVNWFRARFMPDQLIFANANGGHRDIRTAVALKAEGVLAGVADLTILLTDGRNIWVEMKRKKGGVQSKEQKNFQRIVEARGDKYVLGRGFEDAREQILNILES